MTEELIESKLEELEARDDVRAVAIVGSYARNPEQEHNDIDLLAVVNGDWRKRKSYTEEGTVIEVFFNPVEQLEKELEAEGWYKTYHWVKNADVRYDPENLFEGLADYADSRKQEHLELTDPDLEEIHYRIWDMQQDIESDDVGQKRFMMYRMFDYLLEKQYYLRGEVPVKDNYRLKRLKEFDGYMYKLAQDFLTSSSTGEKYRKLEKIVEHVTRNTGNPGPEWETEREEIE